MTLELNELIIGNFTKVLPSFEELDRIEKRVSLIYEKRYKKIVVYAMGTSSKVINLLCNFYSFLNQDFRIQTISDYNSLTTNHLLKELEKNSLIIFCSRSGNTHEVINQLKKITEKAKQQSFLGSCLGNILILTDSEHRSKVHLIAKNIGIDCLNIKNGACGKFECTNSLFFFMIELLYKANDLSLIRKAVSGKEFYKALFFEMSNIDKLVSGLADLNHLMIVYTSNERLNGLLDWFKHLWYETFGDVKINLHLEDYSSMFHSSIQYYLDRPKDKYTLIHIYFADEEVEHLTDNLTVFLKSPEIIRLKVEPTSLGLLKSMVKLIGFMVHLANFFDLNILEQRHVDEYKKKSLEKLKTASSKTEE